ncbi:MAG: acetyl-CoA acetyltransferase [Actinobacteria bacterium]|nr:MAG: acetyl-CoA acetyltransferase [Actinomycetota bacterium]
MTSQFPRSQAAIVGIGCTEFSKNSGVSTFALAARAVKAAVQDAGLHVRDIDGLATFGISDSVSPNLLAQALGIQSMNWYLDQYFGGSVSVSVVAQAALAVSAGVADCVVCYRALNGRSEVRMNGSSDRPMKGPWDIQFKLSTGYIAPAAEIAMAARAHMLRYGTTSEDLGRLAVLSRNHALDNERAMMRTPLTLDDYLQSRWIVEPFRLFDCCLETDGAVAVAVVNAERAKDLPHRPALVQGAAWGGGVNIVNNGQTDLADSPAKLISERLYDNAGLGPADIEFAELYDCFTYTLLSQIEGYGFAEPGGVPAKLADGAFDRATGSLPVNTHGGLLSEGYLHGLNHVYEAVEQIRGDAGVRQIDRHDVGLVAGQLGYLSGYSSALVLAGT